MAPDKKYGEITPDVNGPAEAPRLRADARRNRARLLEVADAVFAAKGTGASTEEIARRANVGIGTVFRHFPTKEALLEAVLVKRMQALQDQARQLAGADDPGAAFFAFLDHIVDQSGTKNAFAKAGADIDTALAQVRQELTGAVETLLVRAQRAGAVRDDVGIAELAPLLIVLARAAEDNDWDRAVLERTLTVIYDGLRP